MTDFKGINPDKNLGANFNSNRQGKGGKANSESANGDKPPAGDPYADLKMDPNRMLDLLATQAKLNIHANFDNTGIERAMSSFMSAVTPEHHAHVSRMMSQAYSTEFGANPTPGVLQELVDHYLIGGVSVQSQ